MPAMSSGVKWSEDYADPNSDVMRVSSAVNEPGVDPIVAYLRRLPRAHEPGAIINYNTGETDPLAILLANAVGEPLSTYL